MERHVSEDVPSWAHFLFMHFIQAFGRALAECMIGNALFFHAREVVSATTVSAVMWRGECAKGNTDFVGDACGISRRRRRVRRS